METHVSEEYKKENNELPNEETDTTKMEIAKCSFLGWQKKLSSFCSSG